MQDISSAVVAGLICGLFGFLGGVWVGVLIAFEIAECAFWVWLAKRIEKRAGKVVR